MGTLSPAHWILVAIVILLLFGPSALSKVSRKAGRTVRTVNDLKRQLSSDPLKAIGSLGESKEQAAKTKKTAPREPTQTSDAPRTPR